MGMSELSDYQSPSIDGLPATGGQPSQFASGSDMVQKLKQKMSMSSGGQPPQVGASGAGMQAPASGGQIGMGIIPDQKAKIIAALASQLGKNGGGSAIPAMIGATR